MKQLALLDPPATEPAAPTDTAAAPGPDHPPCPRCGSQDVRDAEIHGGRSTRRDCRRCNLFLYFTRWYGQPGSRGRGRVKT